MPVDVLAVAVLRLVAVLAELALVHVALVATELPLLLLLVVPLGVKVLVFRLVAEHKGITHQANDTKLALVFGSQGIGELVGTFVIV